MYIYIYFYLLFQVQTINKTIISVFFYNGDKRFEMTRRLQVPRVSRKKNCLCARIVSEIIMAFLSILFCRISHLLQGDALLLA